MIRFRLILFTMAVCWTVRDNHQVLAAPISVPDNTTRGVTSAAGSAIPSSSPIPVESLHSESSNAFTQDASQETESSKNPGTQTSATTPATAPSGGLATTGLLTTSVQSTVSPSRGISSIMPPSATTFHKSTVSQPTGGPSPTSSEFPWQEVTFGLAAFSGVLLICCVAVSILACKIKGKLKHVHRTLYPVTVDHEHVYQDLQPHHKSNDKVELTAITWTGVEEIDSPTFSPSAPPIPFSRTTRTSSGENHSSSVGRVTLNLAPEPPIQPPPRRVTASSPLSLVIRGNDKKQQKNNTPSSTASYVNEAFSSEPGRENKRSIKRGSKKTKEKDQSVTGLYDDDDDSCIYEDYEHNEGYDIGMIDDVLVENTEINISKTTTEEGVVLRKPLVGDESDMAFTHTELTERQTSLSGLPDMVMHRSSSKEQFRNALENAQNVRISDGIPGNDLNGGIPALPDTNISDESMCYDDADVLPVSEKLVENTNVNIYDVSVQPDADEAEGQNGTNQPGELQESLDSLAVYDDADVDIDTQEEELPLYEDYAITTEKKKTVDTRDIPSDSDHANDLLGFPTLLQQQDPDMKGSSGNEEPTQTAFGTDNQCVTNGADLTFGFEKVTDNGVMDNPDDSFQDLNQIAAIPFTLPSVPPRKDLLVQSQGSSMTLEDDVLNTNNASSNISPVCSSDEPEQHPHNRVPLHLDVDEVQMRPGRKMSELETPSPGGDYFLDMDDIPSELSERAQRRISVHKRRSDEICLTNAARSSSELMDMLGNGVVLDQTQLPPVDPTSFPSNSLMGLDGTLLQNGGVSNRNDEEPIINLMDEDIYDVPSSFQH